MISKVLGSAMPRKNTSQLLKQLRLLMHDHNYVPQTIHAYVVPSGDAHQSEYIAPCDERRAFICGFTGSAGTAIVTTEKAAMWTDGRYFLQATQEMDDNWKLMKQGVPETLSEGKWLCNNLNPDSVVGANPFLIDADKWQELSRELHNGGHSLVAVMHDLVDQIWTGQPARPCKPVFPLDIKYTGATVQEKLTELRKQMKEENASMVVLTALDEVAYIYNLRGSDIAYNPVFFSYALVTHEEAYLFIDEAQCPSATKAFLQEANIIRKPYGDFMEFIEKKIKTEPNKVWVSNKGSHAVNEVIPKEKRLAKVTPVAVMKAIKNETEIKGLRACHLRDAVALCRFFCWLEGEASKGTQTEISAADKLQTFREELEDFVGLSFETISSIGPNGAIIHYKPRPETDRKITTEELYLCDSGGQYKDGTTDVTRTLHFGTPTQFERQCFTRVLKGQIALASAIFPTKIKGNCLDTLARLALWDVGLDYSHGTGHGVGMYLNVHEGPMGISWRPMPDDPGLQENMFLSDEPGYYEDNKFGIRLENIVQIVRAETPHNHRNRGFLTFKNVTMVPVQIKMIEPSMLTEKEVKWLNNYHAECREQVGKLLLQQGHKEAYDWLVKQTEPIG
ncbi:aminopeptidase P isoform X2 [Oratosquilla oratoria]|uniref:aminopeptidase P isoform X2 n=1 Tax=Oratosquilla oratoria TaxID=337810 RepID=UPI003F7781EA